MSDEVMHQYTVYDHPRDYPGGYVVRQWLIGTGTVTPGPAMTAPTLEEARELIPADLVRTLPSPGDDPVILETWI